MIHIELIISGVLGILATVISSRVSWLSAKKKYYTEVDSNEIKNLKDSIDVYNDTIKTLRDEIELTRSENIKNQREIYRLKSIIVEILNMACSDEKCKKRKFLSEQKIKDILREHNEVQ